MDMKADACAGGLTAYVADFICGTQAGDLPADVVELCKKSILDGIGLYAQTSDGIVPWKARPEAFRKGVVARIPPFPPSAAQILPDAAE